MSHKQLTTKTFIMGMEYLGAFYATFKIDLDNKLVQKVWYGAFSNVSDAQFQELIQSYCQNNEYGPVSPTHLINYFIKSQIKTKTDAESAWNILVDVIRDEKRKFTEWHPALGALFDLKQAIKSIDDEIIQFAATRTILEKSDIKNDFRRKEFIEKYNDRLKNIMTQQAQNILGTTAFGGLLNE